MRISGEKFLRKARNYVNQNKILRKLFNEKIETLYFLYTLYNQTIQLLLYIQCDAIRWEQILRRCHLGQLYQGITRWRQHFRPNIIHFMSSLLLCAELLIYAFSTIPFLNLYSKDTKIFSFHNFGLIYCLRPCMPC